MENASLAVCIANQLMQMLSLIAHSFCTWLIAQIMPVNKESSHTEQRNEAATYFDI